MIAMPSITRILLLTFVVLTLSGCGYTRLAVSKVQAFFHSTPENIKAAAPENCLLATGRLSGNFDRNATFAVVAVTRWETEKTIADYCLIKGSSPFFLYLHEGDYQFLLFADLNHDSIIDQNELVGSWNNQQELRIDKHRAAKGIFRDIIIAADISRIRKSGLAFRVAIPERKHAAASRTVSIADVTTLDDERFSNEISSQGLYEPSRFLRQVDRFFYMLEEYDPSKTPVIFVHGINGTPRDWAFFVKGLDRNRFQPLFFYYPSGLRLETVTEIFYDQFLSGRHIKIAKPVIAAHSQGGLIVRSALNRLPVKGNASSPRLFISFCTPYGGVASATMALSKRSPVIVPSWIDLASNSQFLESLYREKTPAEIPFHLFFAYGNSKLFKLGPNDDGIVSLKSQLDQRAQREAVRIRGFNETHSGILDSKEVQEAFSSILSEIK